MSNSASPERSVTTVGTASPSINGLATPASTGVTSPIHSDESHGVINGTGIWDRLSDGTYVTDYYMTTPSFNSFSPGLPRC